jgi:hypothetical protein
MKRYVLATVITFSLVGTSVAQRTSSTGDILGAHFISGRGCSACHAPHNGSSGNGNARSTDAGTGNPMLWGQDASSLYGKTITTGGGKFVEVLPSSMSAGTPDVSGMLTCLSCHDGNYASGAMMKNKLYETVPSTYGTHNAIPTLLGSDGASTGIYLNDHPTGLSAKISCGTSNGTSNWDCTIGSRGEVRMTGANSSRFVSNYGFFVKPANYNNTPVVMCTTCHEPHAMSVVTITSGSTSGLPAGSYSTMFFLRAPYNPNDTNPMSNQTAQFCRQCHADKSNEMNGSTAGTVF